MKVAINRCYGGFGISQEAFMKLLERKEIAYETSPSKFAIRDSDSDFWVAGHVGEDEYYISEYEYYKDRSDPDLIYVIEQYGESANSWASEIAIVDIPDEVEWHIAEYDGIEWVAENHQTWR